MSTALIVFGAALAIWALVHTVYWIVISRVLGREVRAVEFHRIVTADGWSIRLCRYTPESGPGEPVFFCHGATANQHNFSEPAGDSFIDALVEQGYDCWAVDLRGSRSSIPPAGTKRYDASFDDYLLYDLPAVLGHIRRKTRYEKVHWVGHSMGGMLLYAYELIHGPGELASAVTLGAPPGFPGVRVPRFESGVFRFLLNLSPAIAELCLRSLAPLAPLVRVHASYAPINWNNMHPGMGPASFFNLLELLPLKVVGDLTYWASGNPWCVNRLEVNVGEGLNTLETPLFLVFGQDDPFVPLTNAESFFRNLPTDDKQMLVLSEENGHGADYDHVDLVFGRNGREEVYLPAARWLQKHPIGRMVWNALLADWVGAEAGQKPALAQKRSGLAKVKVRQKKRAVAKRKSKPAAKTKTRTPAKKKRAAKKKSGPKAKSKSRRVSRKKMTGKMKPRPAKKKPGKKKAPSKRPAKKTSTKKKISPTRVAPKKKAPPKKAKPASTPQKGKGPPTKKAKKTTKRKPRKKVKAS